MVSTLHHQSKIVSFGTYLNYICPRTRINTYECKKTLKYIQPFSLSPELSVVHLAADQFCNSVAIGIIVTRREIGTGNFDFLKQTRPLSNLGIKCFDNSVITSITTTTTINTIPPPPPHFNHCLHHYCQLRLLLPTLTTASITTSYSTSSSPL